MWLLDPKKRTCEDLWHAEEIKAQSRVKWRFCDLDGKNPGEWHYCKTLDEVVTDMSLEVAITGRVIAYAFAYDKPCLIDPAMVVRCQETRIWSPEDDEVIFEGWQHSVIFDVRTWCSTWAHYCKKTGILDKYPPPSKFMRGRPVYRVNVGRRGASAI